MNRLLVYVHFNKYDKISSHVYYQLEQIRPLFSKLIFVTNSQLSDKHTENLAKKGLINEFIQRQNQGYDFAAWKDGLFLEGFDNLDQYDSVTVMNDTCFGPLWDLEAYYKKYEEDVEVDFWGMTNHAEVKGHNIYIPEHLQSYFISFKKSLVKSEIFKKFWSSVESYTDVQKVIDEYETQYTKIFTKAGFHYTAVLDTVPIHQDYFHRNFTIHYPQVLLDYRVPFIKIKTFDLSQHLSPYTLRAVEEKSDYPVSLIDSHMTSISNPTPAYLLERKIIEPTSDVVSIISKVAVHLHTFYLDLLPDFLTTFRQSFSFNYDLFLTTDSEDKKSQIEKIVEELGMMAEIIVTGKKGRDVIPMLKLKEKLSKYDYIGHFHTKKSKEADFWAGESWRKELIDMLIKPANQIIANFESQNDLGLVIADIPTFFRFNKIVDAYNEHLIAPEMNHLWKKMNLSKEINFEFFHTFVMSYGTYVWFRYDALQPLFDLELKDEDIPKEPLPQNSILHAIERMLIYIAWDKNYDFRISKNPVELTAFIDNKLLNERGEALPHTYVNFDHLGGIKGAVKYIFIGPARAVKYIVRRVCTKYLKIS